MKSLLLSVLGGASTVQAAVKGFNYAANGQTQSTFEAQFKTAASLAGTTDFTGARLYTMIQDGTTTDVISALPAAVATNTTLLLGLWASQDQNGFNNELTALKAAISQYAGAAPLVTGISVGSEDLYRISPMGIANGENPGQSPQTLVSYIQQVRDTIKNTAWANIPVGHVDTWNIYVNQSNSDVIANVDFLGLDEYPYYQNTDPNTIDNAQKIFFQSYDNVVAVAQGKPVWVTEAGWPTTGPNFGQAVASVSNAETFWQQVSCQLQNRNINMWWYILADDSPSTSFAVSSNGVPKYNLTCDTTEVSSSSSSSSLPSNSASGSATVTSAHSVETESSLSSVVSASATSVHSIATGASTSSSTSASVTSSPFHGAGSKVGKSFTSVGLAAAAVVALACQSVVW